MQATPAPSRSKSGWKPALDAYCPALVKAAAEAERFVAEMEEGRPGRWLSLVGDPGVGKTMLARQILAQSKQSNPGRFSTWISGPSSGDHERNPRPRCCWIDASQFANNLMQGEFFWPEHFFNDWCVVFDDLGAARDTKSDFIADAIYRFANTRLGRWTVWTSNLSLELIGQRIDMRVASRLIRDENITLKIVARDYALTGRKP